MKKINYMNLAFRLLALLFLFCNSVWAEDLYITDFVPDLYLGQWFEIARLPLYFENKCIPPIMAEYTKNDSDIAVKNSCMTPTGELSVANGMAYFSESNSIGKLKVTFLPRWLRFTHLGRADYWIIYTDYKYALVGSPDYKYLWILARTESYDQDRVEFLINVAKIKGYDTTKLIFNYPRVSTK
jgi:apolipoprotein D and lipocalin family protein